MEKQTLELYRLYGLAAQGDADAQYRLGMRYLNGVGVAQDIRLAYIWIGKAADNGHPKAKSDLGILRDVGLEKAVKASGIPTDVPAAAVEIPAPKGYAQYVAENALKTLEAVTPVVTEPVVVPEKAPVKVEQVVITPSVVTETVQPVVPEPKPVVTSPVAAPAPAPKPVPKPSPFARQSTVEESEESGGGAMKKVFWGVVVLLVIVVAGWFFKGSIWGDGKSTEDKPVNNKAVILTDRDQKEIARKVFDRSYGEGTYKNGCWATEGNACMKFKQVNAVPVKGSSLYNLYVYAFSTTGPGRIDAYTVEVDANTPNEFRILSSSTGVVAESGDGRKTWKFAKGGRSWSVDSVKEHDGVRETIRSTYTIVGSEIRSSRVLLKSESLAVDNTDEGQAANAEAKPEDRSETRKVEVKPENKPAQNEDVDRIGQKIKSLGQ